MGSGQMMPELGSRISLISKADIRYEGRLFTVDPQECTIALANVRSFGTEDRESAYPIMPQPTVYDYILFRGSDIKDIRVVNNVAIPNDPAIMQMQMNQQPGGFPPQMQQGPGQFGPFGNLQGPPPMGQNIPPQQAPTTPNQAQSSQQAQPSQSSPQQQPLSQQGNNSLLNSSASGLPSKKASDLLSKIDLPFPSTTSSSSDKLTSSIITSNPQSTPNSLSNELRKLNIINNIKNQDSRSDTPNQSRKSPTSDMGVQTAQRSGGENQGAHKDKMQRNNNQRNNNNNNNNSYHQQYQERRDSGRNDGYRNQRMPPQNHQQPQRGGYNNNNNKPQRGGSGRMPMMRGPPQQNATFFQNYRQNNPQHQNRQQNPQQQQQQQQQQQNRPMNKPPNKNQNTLKFENEFDFETENIKFEKLRSEISKLKVGSEETKNPEQQVNGEVEKKDDSGNETGADHDQQEGDDYNGYDKAKSFFDNISCEANERSKGKTQRTDWRQERKINTETFGPSMNRRGGMRGRGGYYRNQYGRPMNNYRGGGGQQYRNNNMNRNRNNPQQGGRINNNNQGQQSATTAPAEK